MAALLLAGRGLDLLTTWLASPNLEHETNPAVLFYGLGWPGFLLYQSAVTAFLLLCIGHSLRFQRRLANRPEEEARPDRGHPMKHHWLGRLFSPAGSVELVVYLLVYFFSRAAILSGFFVALWNFRFYLRGEESGGAALLVSLIPPASLMIVFALFYIEHRALEKRRRDVQGPRDSRNGLTAAK